MGELDKRSNWSNVYYYLGNMEQEKWFGLLEKVVDLGSYHWEGSKFSAFASSNPTDSESYKNRYLKYVCHLWGNLIRLIFMCRLFLNVGRTGFGVIFRDENVYVLVPVAKFMKEEFDVHVVKHWHSNGVYN